MRGLTVFCPLILCGLVVSNAQAQLKLWRQVAKVVPSGRQGHVMAYFPSEEAAVLFGGIQGRTILNDTWIWNEKGWATHGNHKRIAYAAFAWDGKQLILFGGYDTDPGKPIDEAWSFNVKGGWQRIRGGPIARRNHAMAYAGSGKTILFGGRYIEPGGNRGYLSDTWVWDNRAGTWTDVSPVVLSPGARADHSMAYIPSTGEVLLFGGRDLTRVFGETWLGSWDNQNKWRWTPVDTKGNAPSPRSPGHAMASYDRHGVVVLYGGRGQDTWEWRGKERRWEKIASATNPAVREDYALAYFKAGATTEHVLLYGDNPSQTWTYDRPRDAAYMTFGKGWPGSRGAPLLDGDPPRLGMTSLIRLTNLPPLQIGALVFGNKELKPPQDLTIFGMPGCKLYASLVIDFAINTRNGSTTLPLTVPADRRFLNITFFNQGFVRDPAANVLGVIASNAGKGVIGF